MVKFYNLKKVEVWRFLSFFSPLGPLTLQWFLPISLFLSNILVVSQCLSSDERVLASMGRYATYSAEPVKENRHLNVHTYVWLFISGFVFLNVKAQVSGTNKMTYLISFTQDQMQPWAKLISDRMQASAYWIFHTHDLSSFNFFPSKRVWNSLSFSRMIEGNVANKYECVRNSFIFITQKRIPVWMWRRHHLHVISRIHLPSLALCQT